MAGNAGWIITNRRMLFIGVGEGFTEKGRRMSNELSVGTSTLSEAGVAVSRDAVSRDLACEMAECRLSTDRFDPLASLGAPMAFVRTMMVVCGLAALCGCGRGENPPAIAQAGTPSAIYRVGPLDSLDIFVWRMPELSRTVTVRPDGRISMPLIDDLVATGKTPSQLAADIEHSLTKYVQDPTVTVIVGGFHGPFDQQVRIIGEAADPQALPYQANMTVLDVMIAVHGLTRFASGNRAELVRVVDGRETTIPVRLDDLIKDGDVGANVPVEPGDILIIPQAWF